jgi:predicted outer membrane lipoprotein
MSAAAPSNAAAAALWLEIAESRQKDRPTFTDAQ